MGVKMKKLLISLSVLLFSWNSFGQPLYRSLESSKRATNTSLAERNTQNTGVKKNSNRRSNPSNPQADDVALLRGRRSEEQEIEEEKRIEEEEKNRKAQINKGSQGVRITDNYTFSGADCDVFVFRSGNRENIRKLESVATVSISIYEAKAPVRRLGYASPVGFSGNIRSIAGSIICYLGDNHPLDSIRSTFNKHKDDEYNELISGRIEPFNMILMYKNEIGKDYKVIINNIEIISEGLVTSVNDMATEMVFQFVATEAKLIDNPS